MSPRDIDAFLAVKQHIVRVRWLQASVTAVAIVAMIAIWVLNRGDHGVLNWLAGFMTAMCCFLTVGTRSDVARDRLVALVEKQINREPEALRHLAGHSSR